MLLLATFVTLKIVSALPTNHSPLAPRYPLQNSTVPSSGISCPNGGLICNGLKEFGLCNAGSVIWQAVTPGTSCSCDATGACSLVNANSGIVPGGFPPSASTVSLSPGATAMPPSPVGTDCSGPTSAASAAPTASSGSSYVVYKGNGEPSEGWPPISAWMDFDTMWTKNLAARISGACADFKQKDNSEEESAEIKAALQSHATAAKLDERWVLAMLLQESGGCVRAPTTNYGVRNPGMMQSHNGTHTCFNVNPCPKSEIEGMVQDGVDGTASGAGLKQLVAQTNATDVSKYYKASRLYNSGSIAASGKLEDGIATHSYCSDVANRLTGNWITGPSKFT